MSVTFVLTRSWKRSDSSAKNYEKSVTSDAEASYSGQITDGTADQDINITIDYSAMTALLIGSDQDITLETNNPGGSSGAADQTFALKANCPILWTEDDIETNPITTDITVIYVTNDSGETANLEIHALYDSTP